MRLIGLMLLVVTHCHCSHVAPCIPGQVVNVVDHGATGDGVTDDSAAIQAAVLCAGAGGTVQVPPGNYLITASDGTGATGVLLTSDLAFEMSPAATLIARPTKSDYYGLLRVLAGVHDVTIRGGVLQGERQHHVDVGGGDPKHQHGVGVDIGGASHILVEGVTAKDFQGDGFYVGNQVVMHDTASDIVLRDCKGTGNFRRGLTVSQCDGGRIEHCHFDGVAADPTQDISGAGIGLLPNDGQSIGSMTITDCVITNNLNGIHVSLGGGDHNNYNVITGNQVVNNVQDGIFIQGNVTGTYLKSAQHAKVSGNTVVENGRNGIHLLSWQYAEVSGNTVVENGWHGILIESSQLVDVVGMNIVTGSGLAGIAVVASSSNQLLGNTVSDSSRETAQRWDQIWLNDQAMENTISGNTCRIVDLMFKPRYGLRIEAGCQGNIVSGNDLRDSGTLGSFSEAEPGMNHVSSDNSL